MTAISKLVPLSITVDHPRLLDTDGESIRAFFGKYEQYANEVFSRARQLASATSLIERARPIDPKFCVDVEFLESTITLGSIEKVSFYEE